MTTKNAADLREGDIWTEGSYGQVRLLTNMEDPLTHTIRELTVQNTRGGPICHLRLLDIDTRDAKTAEELYDEFLREAEKRFPHIAAQVRATEGTLDINLSPSLPESPGDYVHVDSDIVGEKVSQLEAALAAAFTIKG
jgi:hypothetical protein